MAKYTRQQFANLRLLYDINTHPGKKLLFM